jgi:hypothetical protein
MFNFLEIKERIIEIITDISILIIKKVNRYKNRCLSQKLFNIAETYNTRPNTNNYNKVDNMRRISADAISEKEYENGTNKKIVKEAIQVATLALKIAEIYSYKRRKK